MRRMSVGVCVCVWLGSVAHQMLVAELNTMAFKQCIAYISIRLYFLDYYMLFWKNILGVQVSSVVYLRDGAKNQGWSELSSLKHQIDSWIYVNCSTSKKFWISISNIPFSMRQNVGIWAKKASFAETIFDQLIFSKICLRKW